MTTALLIIWLSHSCASVAAGFIFFYIPSLHFKYNFRQINDRIERCLRSGNSVLIFVAIKRHNYCTELTLLRNKIFKYVLVSFYLIITPALNILVYLVVSQVNTYLRLIYLFAAINLFLYYFHFNTCRLHFLLQPII